MGIDFNRTAGDYRKHRQGFPPMFLERLQQAGLIGPGRRLLDVGTGTGTIARGAAQAGCAVTAIDIAPELMAQAADLDRAAGVAITYRVARAEATGLDAGTFDTVTAGQCWHWFDRAKAAAEVWRLLVAGGSVVIAHLDWIPLPGNVVAATENLILKHNPAWTMDGGTGLYPAWLADLTQAGFGGIETASFDLDLIYTPEAWRGRIRASAGVAASLGPDAVAVFDAELRAMLAQDFPGEALPVHHRVWWVSARKGGA